MTALEDLQKHLNEANEKWKLAVKNNGRTTEFMAWGVAAWLVPIFALYGLVSFAFDVVALFVD